MRTNDFGKIEETWVIGDITIDKIKWKTPYKDDKPGYMILIEGKDMHFHTFSLETAIIQAITMKYEKRVSEAPRYFMKMIGMKEDENVRK